MTVSQFAWLCAVHGRSGVAITAMSPFAPFTEAVVSAGEMAKESVPAPAGRPAWRTTSVSVPIRTRPVRASQLGFSFAATATVPPPWPLPASATESQLASTSTSHVVSAAAVTTMATTWAV